MSVVFPPSITLAFNCPLYIMDDMLEENKNLKVTSNISSQYEKDTHASSVSDISDKYNSHCISYTKTNKLITALYMVTDMIDKEEPLRNKLRVLGSDVISDTTHTLNLSHSSKHTTNKISEILSFLDIASAVGMISEMNRNILKKEFIELKKSIDESKEQEGLSLAEIFQDNSFILPSATEESVKEKIEDNNNFENKSTNNIGVQKGSTLLKALSQVVVSNTKNHMSDSRPKVSNKISNSVKNKIGHQTSENDFDALKKKRREEITKIVKENKEAHPTAGGTTITDIRTGAKGVLLSCGEKTLQRELVSMVKDTLLNKIGEKRWSRYSLRT